MTENENHLRQESLPDLQKMRRLATFLLCIMAIILGLSSYFQSYWKGFSIIRAFSEAALVGGFADWFAVSALFRHPFGLPIPHTAIIPRNKHRIATGLGNFIANNFLTKAVISQNLKTLSPARKIADYLNSPEKAEEVTEGLLKISPAIIDIIDQEKIRHFVGLQLKDLALSLEAVPLLSMTALSLCKKNLHVLLLDHICLYLEDFIRLHEKEFQEGISLKSYSWMPRWVDEKIGQRLVDSLLDLVSKIKESDHPWRLEINHKIIEWLEKIKDDEETIARGEKIKKELLDDPALALGGVEFWYQAFAHIRHLPRNPATKAFIKQYLIDLGEHLRKNETLRNRLDHWLFLGIERYAIPKSQVIGQFIATIVSRWETSMLVRKLEEQVGTDLQFIRINGTVVGGLIGLILHFLTGG
jgi:uncharacterized membrane-anchored protein YjiN (DUF445 family)